MSEPDPTRETTDDRNFFAETMEAADEGFRAEILTSKSSQDPTPDPPTSDDPGAPALSEPGLSRLTGPDGPRYRVDELLGRGGGGLVFSLRDRELARSVALKVLHPKHAQNDKRVDNLLHEAVVTADLEHPGILPVHEVGTADDGRVYFTMRRASGRPLEDLLLALQSGGDKRLAELDERVAVMLTVCEAIRFAHDRGYIHQDIKPGNIMLGGYGEVIVLDWGAARRLDDAGDQRAAGTPMYMSPEQARHERSDQRSDIYCLGSTMFHCFLLRYPLLEGNHTIFWEKKRKGLIDAIDAKTRRRIPDALMRIVLKAMDPHPQHRYQQVGELIDDLRAYQRNAKSISVCEQGERRLGTLQQQTDYHQLESITDDFRQALSLWPDNSRAQRGLIDIRLRHAMEARRRGDFALGLELLDSTVPEHAQLRSLLELSQSRRARMRVLARVSTIAAALLLIAIVWMSIAEHRRRQSAWITVATIDCTSDHISQRLIPSPWSEHHGELIRSDEGIRFPDEFTWWIAGVAERGDVSITVDISWPEAVDALELVLRAKQAEPRRLWHPAQGYYCQFGGFRGNIHIIGANRKPGALDILYSAPAELEAGRRYRLTYRLIGDEQQMLVDGRLVLRRRELLPMSDAESQWISLRCWGQALIHHIIVERKSLPQEVEPLIAGDSLVSHGHLDEAIRVYRALAADYEQADIAGRALARAVLCALELGRSDADSLLLTMRTRFPEHPDLIYCEEQACLALWRSGRLASALDQAAAIQAREPESRLGLQFLRNRPDRIADAQLHDLMALCAGIPDLVSLDISGWGFEDIAPLAGQRLSMLKMDNNRISDISALRGMPLRQLSVNNNRITDISALHGMPLDTIDISMNPIDDIAVLRGMQLEVLRVERTDISDLSPLAGMQTLRRLDIGSTAVDNLAPLAGLHNLARLSLTNSKVEDIGPLAGLPLDTLRLEGQRIDSLEALRGMPLHRLELSACTLSDLTPLRGMPLRLLRVDDCPVDTIEVVRELPELTWLAISNTAITDLRPLHDSHVSTLDISDTAVNSNAGLEALELDILHARNTRLTAGQIMPLKITQQVSIGSPQLTIDDYDRIHDRWQQEDRSQALLRTLRVCKAMQFNDSAGLRREAADAGQGVRYLALPYRCSLEEARLYAARHGARLPAPKTPGQWATLGRIVTVTCWLDLHQTEGQLLDSQGSAVHPSFVQPWIRHADYDCFQFLAYKTGQGAITGFRDEVLTSQLCLSWDADTKPGAVPE